MEIRRTPGEEDQRKDADLVKSTLAGEQGAYAVLVERYWRMVFSLGYRTCRDVNDAEDIAQESFLAALGSLSKLKDPAKFSSWLYGLTMNTARSFVRRKARSPLLSEPLHEDDSGEPTVLEDMTDRERHIAVMQAVVSLKPIYRSVIELRYISRLSCEEIAQRLGEPSGTIRSRLCRASEILRRKMQKYR